MAPGARGPAARGCCHGREGALARSSPAGQPAGTVEARRARPCGAPPPHTPLAEAPSRPPTHPPCPAPHRRALAALLKELHKRSLQPQAVEIFDWLRSLPPGHELAHLLDVYTYTTMIVGCARVRERACFQAFVDRAAVPGSSAESAVGRQHSWGSRAGGYMPQAAPACCCPPPPPARGTPSPPQSQCTGPSQLRRALALARDMRARGVAPNTHTFSSIINVCIKAGEPDMALETYSQVCAAASNGNSLNHAAACARASRTGGRTMPDSHPPPHPLPRRQGLTLLPWLPAPRPQMLAEGCTPNLVTYNTLLEVFAKQAKWEEAVSVLDSLQSQVRAGSLQMCACVWVVGCVRVRLCARARACACACACLRVWQPGGVGQWDSAHGRPKAPLAQPLALTLAPARAAPAPPPLPAPAHQTPGPLRRDTHLQRGHVCLQRGRQVRTDARSVPGDGRRGARAVGGVVQRRDHRTLQVRGRAPQGGVRWCGGGSRRCSVLGLWAAAWLRRRLHGRLGPWLPQHGTACCARVTAPPMPMPLLSPPGPAPRLGAVEAACAMLQEMAARACERTPAMFMAVLQACEAGGRWRAALSTLDAMQASGSRLTPQAYAAAVGACAAGERAPARPLGAASRLRCGLQACVLRRGLYSLAPALPCAEAPRPVSATCAPLSPIQTPQPASWRRRAS